MNVKESKAVDIDPAVVRILEFVEDHGGPSEVARKLGKHPQLFYNMQNGRSKVSLDTLKEIALAYPGELDLNMIILGLDSPFEQPPTVESNFQAEEATRLIEEAEKKAAQAINLADSLQKDKEQMWGVVNHLKEEINFTGVSSQTTGGFEDILELYSREFWVGFQRKSYRSVQTLIVG